MVIVSGKISAQGIDAAEHFVFHRFIGFFNPGLLYQKLKVSLKTVHQMFFGFIPHSGFSGHGLGKSSLVAESFSKLHCGLCQGGIRGNSDENWQGF